MENALTLEDLENLRGRLEKESELTDKKRIRVCTGTACVATGAHAIIDAIAKETKDKRVDLEIVKTGCQKAPKYCAITGSRSPGMSKNDQDYTAIRAIS